MKPPALIETERLLLRVPRLEDAPAVFAGWVQDPEVTHFLTWRPHEHIGQTEAMLQNAMACWEGEARFPYMITLKATSAVIGMIDPRIQGTKVEVGYVMGQAHQGQGYMTEALRALIAWAFQQPTIYRVYATTDLENVASRRVMEKAGMSCEGILRKYILHPNLGAEPRDSFMFAIVK